jgi:hypothetical protein
MKTTTAIRAGMEVDNGTKPPNDTRVSSGGGSG